MSFITSSLQKREIAFSQAARYPFILTTLAEASTTFTLMIAVVFFWLTEMIRHYYLEVIESIQRQVTAEIVQHSEV